MNTPLHVWDEDGACWIAYSRANNQMHSLEGEIESVLGSPPRAFPDKVLYDRVSLIWHDPKDLVLRH